MSIRLIAGYIPVLHEGYLQFFARHPDCSTVAIIPREIAQRLSPECEYLRKDLRALDAEVVAQALRALFPERRIVVVNAEVLRSLDHLVLTVVLPDEDVSHAAAAQFFPDASVEYDTVFLRWDRRNVTAQDPVRYDRTTTADEMTRALFRIADDEARKSTNWWRRVGAIITADGVPLLAAHNAHVPSPHLPYAEGDARACFSRGVNIELTTDFHAEATIIAEAARRGIPLAGTELYVTTFPCPPCGKLIAHSGIVRCYFSEGYAMLDSERILREAGIELVLVQKEKPSD